MIGYSDFCPVGMMLSREERFPLHVNVGDITLGGAIFSVYFLLGI